MPRAPYTGGHCQRVPELARMLTQAACSQQTGPFADFRLNEEEWEAIHIASWLHDCGKVTTPEFVVDKATKLETIYDRIHEIRTRFEGAQAGCPHRGALRPAAPIRAAGRPRGPAPPGTPWIRSLPSWPSAIWGRVDGAGETGQAGCHRQPHLVAHSGRSARHQSGGTQAPPGGPLPPCRESLLADKAVHLIPAPSTTISPDTTHGASRCGCPPTSTTGERYNLAIGRGTLTEEERYKINDHIIQTIRMLEKLPFPAICARCRRLRGPSRADGRHGLSAPVARGR